MLDLDGIRGALSSSVAQAVPELNVYPYPEPQPEYPALRLPTITAGAYHATAEGGSTIEWTAELIVADPGTEDATQRLEALLEPVMIALEEAIKSDTLINVVCRGFGNFRDQSDSLVCDLLIQVHA